MKQKEIESPILYHQGKKGELRQWRVYTVNDKIYTEYGICGGILQISSVKAEPKNVGKSNETTASEQARLEAKALWKFKLDRKYSLTKKKAKEQLLLPMLAHTYSGTKKDKFQFPAYIQPKLDGVRCIAKLTKSGIELTSRQGKPWILPHISKELLSWLPKNCILDGEVYSHGTSLQQIMSAVKRADPSSSKYDKELAESLLVYHIYDIPTWEGEENLTWEKRNKNILDLSKTYSSNYIKFLKSNHVTNKSDVFFWHDKYTREHEYEGSILRATNSTYLWGYRSSDLLKVKDFQDAEFLVVNVIEGVGKMEGHAIFICQNDESNHTFECTMKTAMKERKKQYENRKKYINKMLTVKFFDRTDSKIPRFPVGIAFRDDRDLPSIDVKSK